MSAMSVLYLFLNLTSWNLVSMTYGEKFFNKLLKLSFKNGVFIGQRVWRTNSVSIFGGELIAQSIVAAYQTVPADHFIHSLHGYFCKHGVAGTNVNYQVLPLTSGRTFHHRQVHATQEDHIRFTMMASFKRPEPNYMTIARDLDGRYQSQDLHINIDKLPRPETLKSGEELLEDMKNDTTVDPRRKKVILQYFRWMEHYPCQIRPCDPMSFIRRVPSDDAKFYIWVRLKDCPDSVEELHLPSTIAYMSDMGILQPVFTKRHDFTAGLITSLDHAMWFHGGSHRQLYHPKQWLLFEFQCDVASHGLILCKGRAFNHEGIHLASIAQEGLARPHRGTVSVNTDTAHCENSSAAKR